MQLWVINQSVVSTYEDIKGNMQVNLGMSSPKKDVQQKKGPTTSAQPQPERQ